MCGRTACTLAPAALRKACRYPDPASGMETEPDWEGDPSTGPGESGGTGTAAPVQDEPALPPASTTTAAAVVKEEAGAAPAAPAGPRYKRSYNTCPHHTTPVLIQLKDGRRKLRLMRWGLLPSWHRGHPWDFKPNMINARVEGILAKASFRRPLEQGQRCVVVADGFFEWHKNDKGERQPYYLHFPPDADGKPRVLTFAGIYDTWFPKASASAKSEAASAPGSQGQAMATEAEAEQDEAAMESTAPADVPEDEDEGAGGAGAGNWLASMAAATQSAGGAAGKKKKSGEPKPRPEITEPIHSYTILTMPVTAGLAWLHTRMPAILETPEEMAAWLDPSTPTIKALSGLKQCEHLQWHPVSKKVGNIRCNDEDLVKQVSLEEKKKKPTSLMNWVKTGKMSPKKPKAPAAQPSKRKPEGAQPEPNKRARKSPPPPDTEDMEADPDVIIL